MYYGSRYKHKAIVGLSLIPPIIVAGLRYAVGTDYRTYVSIYENLSMLNQKEFLATNISGIEIGYYWLIKFSAGLYNDPKTMFILASALTIGFFYMGLKRFNPAHKAQIYFLYLMTIFPLTLNAVRQGIAMSICFFAFSYISEKKFKHYAFWLIAASLFHLSSIVLLPLYFINKLVKTTSLKDQYISLAKILSASLVLFILLPLVGSFFSSFSIFNRYAEYKYIVSEGKNYLFFLKATIMALVLILYKRIARLDNNAVFLTAFAVLEVACTTLGFALPILSRVSLYFAFYSIILLSYIPDVFSDRFGRYISKTAIIVYGFSFFILIYYVAAYSQVMPYMWAK